MTRTTACGHAFRGLGMLGLLTFLWPVTLAIVQATPEPAQVILHLLDYVAVDYPQCIQDGTVLDQSEYDEQVEFSQQVRTLLNQLPAHSARSSLLSQTEQLVVLIQDKRPGPEVSALAHQLRWHIIRAYNVEVAPKRPPDLGMAAVLYQAQCAACHGLQGQGDGPAGTHLDPAPSNFHDRQRMDQRSIYSLYSTVTLGVQGTTMASFRTLSLAWTRPALPTWPALQQQRPARCTPCRATTACVCWPTCAASPKSSCRPVSYHWYGVPGC
jgi:high-affinity iron transporter